MVRQREDTMAQRARDRGSSSRSSSKTSLLHSPSPRFFRVSRHHSAAPSPPSSAAAAPAAPSSATPSPAAPSPAAPSPGAPSPGAPSPGAPYRVAISPAAPSPAASSPAAPSAAVPCATEEVFECATYFEAAASVGASLPSPRGALGGQSPAASAAGGEAGGGGVAAAAAAADQEKRRRPEMPGLFLRGAGKSGRRQQQEGHQREDAAAQQQLTETEALFLIPEDTGGGGGAAAGVADTSPAAGVSAVPVPSQASRTHGGASSTPHYGPSPAAAAAVELAATAASTEPLANHGGNRLSALSVPAVDAVASPSLSSGSSAPLTAASAARASSSSSLSASAQPQAGTPKAYTAPLFSPPLSSAAAAAAPLVRSSSPSSCSFSAAAAPASSSAVASEGDAAGGRAHAVSSSSACPLVSSLAKPEKNKMADTRVIQFKEVCVDPAEVACASRSSSVSQQPRPRRAYLPNRYTRRFAATGAAAAAARETHAFTLWRRQQRSHAHDEWRCTPSTTTYRCEAFEGSAAAAAARGEEEDEQRSGDGAGVSNESLGGLMSSPGDGGALLSPCCCSSSTWKAFCCRRFPLFFPDPLLEQQYLKVHLQHFLPRALLVTPLLMLASGCCYYVASQNCIKGMCHAYAAETGVTEVLLAALLLSLKLTSKPLRKELCATVIIALVSVCQSATSYVAFAVSAVYSDFFPLYAASSVLLNFFFFFFGVSCLCIRVGYATWLMLLSVMLTLPLSILSFIRAAGTAEYSLRLWFTWLSVFLFLFSPLTVALLLQAAITEQHRRVFFLRLKAAMEKQQMEAEEERAILRSRTVAPGHLAERVLACAARQLLDARRRLRKDEPFDREFLAGLLEGAARFITSTEATPVSDEYMKNEFTRSFVKDLLMGHTDYSALSHLPTASLRRRSAFHISPETNNLAALAGVGKDWNWSILQLAEKTNEPLVQVGLALLAPFEYSPELRVRADVLRAFLHEVERACKPNPYHNALHNASVAHQALTLLKMTGIRDFVGDIEEMGFIVSALCHDIAHPGRNNNFMVNAGTPLALTYNDISVLENMHASLTFKLLKNPLYDILAHLDVDTYRALRKNMIEIILSTDMKVHFESISRFRLRRDTGCFDPQGDGDDRQQTLCIVVKAADVGHGALHWELHERWCKRVVTEFYDQGDEEKRRGLPVSFLCDRTQHDTEFFKSQVAFLEFIVKPLFVELEGVEDMRQGSETSEAGEIARTCVANLNNNTEEWRSRERQRLEKLSSTT